MKWDAEANGHRLEVSGNLLEILRKSAPRELEAVSGDILGEFGCGSLQPSSIATDQVLKDMMTFPLSIDRQLEIRPSRCPAEPNGLDASCQSQISEITFAAAIQFKKRVVRALRCFFHHLKSSARKDSGTPRRMRKGNFAHVPRTDLSNSATGARDKQTAEELSDR